MRKILNKSGFTLIELMIVVTIIGLLSAIAIPIFLSYEAKTKQTEAKVNLGSIGTSEMAYFSENNRFSEDLPSIGFSVSIKAKYYDFTASRDFSLPHSGKWIGMHGTPGDGPPAGSIIGFQSSAYYPGANEFGFTAIAVGNIDGDAPMDVWSVSSNTGITAQADNLYVH